LDPRLTAVTLPVGALPRRARGAQPGSRRFDGRSPGADRAVQTLALDSAT